MAPIRRYLRISPYSVLEVRIYLDDPAIVQSWFLNPRNPILPSVIRAVQPLVIPKLREERERAKGKGKKAKGVKDVVSNDDFEVSIFLADTSSRHSLLIKQKALNVKSEKVKSNSAKLTSWLTGSNEQPVSIDEEDTVVIREESDDEGLSLQDFPSIDQAAPFTSSTHKPSRVLGKRRRTADNETLVLDESDESRDGHRAESTAAHDTEENDEHESIVDKDDKKKMGLRTTYDGFSIYGKILCLVVKRKGGTGKIPGAAVNNAGDQLLESWVSSQAAQDQIIDD